MTNEGHVTPLSTGFVGGPPSNFDLPPTIAFLALYSVVLVLSLLALATPSRINVLQLPIIAQIIERIINLCLRLKQSRNGGTLDIALLEYQIITLGWAWIALSQAMGPLLRSLMVNSTRPRNDAGSDEKPLRLKIRRFWLTIDVLFWLANLLGMASGIVWKIELERGEQDNRRDLLIVNYLRYSSTVLGVILTLLSACVAHLAPRRLKNMDEHSCLLLKGLWLLILAVPIYRLCAFSSNTDHFTVPDQHQSTLSAVIVGPPSSSKTAKSLFYIFHVTPEFLVSAVLALINSRHMFATGIWGDKAFSWREGWRHQKELIRRSGAACLSKTSDLIQTVTSKTWKRPESTAKPGSLPLVTDVSSKRFRTIL